MHSSYSLFARTPVIDVFSANTFSGQLVGRLWETRAQASVFSTNTAAARDGLWESLVAFTQLSRRAYTLFPTAIIDRSTVLTAGFSPLSTGPIKRATKFKKKLGDS